MSDEFISLGLRQGSELTKHGMNILESFALATRKTFQIRHLTLPGPAIVNEYFVPYVLLTYGSQVLEEPI